MTQKLLVSKILAHLEEAGESTDNPLIVNKGKNRQRGIEEFDWVLETICQYDERERVGRKIGTVLECVEHVRSEKRTCGNAGLNKVRGLRRTTMYDEIWCVSGSLPGVRCNADKAYPSCRGKVCGWRFQGVCPITQAGGESHRIDDLAKTRDMMSSVGCSL
ncbi:hypothetical protein JTB14_010330 [Gonioctena quinquepunctata]|nr:hypothetical protein JTB14_010330 [Gonioctena quinquepunctata]